jgi:CHAT domain
VTATAPTLVLRFADIGIATYASLRVIGQPARTVTWVVEEPILLAALQQLADALPNPHPGETRRDAVERSLTTGAFATAAGELTCAYVLGVLLIGGQGWDLLMEHIAQPRAVLFVAPSARLAGVPWGLLAVPTTGPTQEELVRARAAATTASGTEPARIPWQLDDLSTRTEGYRLMELVDVLMAAPPNIVHAPRTPTPYSRRADHPPLLILDPRVPGQRPDSDLGSVLGRPTPQSPLVAHFGGDVEQFRRADADRQWLATQLDQAPSRLLFVGHASAADGDLGHADRAAIHLAEPEGLSAADLMAAGWPLPPRIALLACASGGDYQFDEATGLVAAMILGGAQLVTATLWSLPTGAGYRQFGAPVEPEFDPMAELVIAVDDAHGETEAGLAVNRWQRAQMRRWRDGDVTASPLYWAALVSFVVDGER